MTTIETQRGMRQSFTTKPRDLTSILELRSRCYAAARLATQSSNYGPEERADIATTLLCDLWEDIVAQNLAVSGRFKVPTSLSGDRVIYSAKSRAKSSDDLNVWAEIPAVLKSDVPAFHVLHGKAQNLRRSLDSRRARDDKAAGERAATDSFTPHVPGDDPEVRSTPEAAHALAHDMAVAMGLDPRRPVYVAAYTAARTASGEQSAIIAHELEMEQSAYSTALSRGRAAIAAAFDEPALLADALYVPEGGAAQRARPDIDWRSSQRSYGIRPVEVSAVPLTVLPCAPPEWARDLKGTTAHRLRQAATNRAERAAAKDPLQRTIDRLSAGLPAECPR